VTEDTRRIRARAATWRYKDRHREEVRAANRERMRTKRQDPVFLAADKVRLAAYRKTHRAEAVQRSRVWRTDEENRNLARGARFGKKYGITLDQFAARWYAQAGQCLLCQAKLHWGMRYLSPQVDHDHDSKTIRALLCHRCNLALGGFDEDVARLRRAAAYVQGKLRESAVIRELDSLNEEWVALDLPSIPLPAEG
jgi:hypothetical protein